MSFDIDDEDRQHYYKQYGSPDKRWPALRRTRIVFWALTAFVTFLVLFFLTRPRETAVDWHQFAYSLYTTDPHSLCNAILVFESLKRLGSRADRVLFYPKEWDTFIASSDDRTSQLLNIARDDFNVILLPVGLLGQDGATVPGSMEEESSWDSSITKLRAFELTTYNRVMHLDSDLTLLRNLDHLFLLPSAPVAMPRGYWADVPTPTPNQAPQPWPLTSLLLLIEPSRSEFKILLETLAAWRTNPSITSYGDGKKYDMDLLNYRYGSSALVLPQRPYALLTAEFRKTDHSAYLGPNAHWDAQTVLDEAALVHFSDWPLPKPWTLWSADALAEMQPACSADGLVCTERKIWKDLYDDFRSRRRDTCKLLSVAAPVWTKWKNDHGAG